MMDNFQYVIENQLNVWERAHAKTALESEKGIKTVKEFFSKELVNKLKNMINT